MDDVAVGVAVIATAAAAAVLYNFDIIIFTYRTSAVAHSYIAFNVQCW